MTTIENLRGDVAWIEALVPIERRQEGQSLIEELERYRESLIPLLKRIALFLNRSEQAGREAEDSVAQLAGSDMAYEISDDLGRLMSKLDRSLELNALLSNLGFDPDDLPGVDG